MRVERTHAKRVPLSIYQKTLPFKVQDLEVHFSLFWFLLLKTIPKEQFRLCEKVLSSPKFGQD
jgi:hypothetical protein